jgi:carboxypeptidase Q
MLRRFFVLAAVPTLVSAQETVDRAMGAKIRDEGLNRSRAWAMVDTLATVIGPRLTASPAYMRAAMWAKDHFASWGLTNSHFETWPFGRGWELQKFALEMTEPRFAPMIGYPDAWSPSTNGDVVGTPILIAGMPFDSLDKMRSRLKGAIVLTQPLMTTFIRDDRINPTAPNAPPDAPPQPAAAGRGGRGGGRGGAPSDAQRIAALLKEVGVGAVLKTSRGEHGTIFLQTRDAGANAVPTVVVAGEQYNNIIRLLEDRVPVKVRVNVQGRYYTQDTLGYNIIAEIPGTDARLKDEVVMIGAHLDSWHSATGATDNADGAATVLEAARILKAVGARPKRTIRFAIWGGEEQGLYGSRAWVAQHLAGDANKAERDKFSVYLNIDPGYGQVYGWFTEGNDAARAIFDAWMEPFKDLGYRKNVMAGIGNTDHLSFIAQGVPGFNPIQEYTDYDVRIHHTNMDTMERMKPDDLKQSSVIFATLAYNAAMRDAAFPRKELPRTTP